METLIGSRIATEGSPGWLGWFEKSTNRPEAVPAHLQARLPGVDFVLREWVEYVIEVPGATHLLVGNVPYWPKIPGESYFAVQVTNQLGVTRITPYVGSVKCPSFVAEVIAAKFPSAEQSYRFTQSIVDELAGYIPQLPFVVAADTLRHTQRMHGDPGLFFAFHYIRYHGHALRRAIQVITADPHRALTDIVERKRIAEVRSIDAEAIHSLLTGPRAEVAARPTGATPLERLQPLHVVQRRPEETHDTSENRFAVAAATRVLRLLGAIRSEWWWEQKANTLDRSLFDDTERALKIMLRSDPWRQLSPALRIPAYSRVLQNRAGYRELTRFWTGLSTMYTPVLTRLGQALDLRDVPTLYEHWLFFALSSAIANAVGEPPTYHINHDPYPQSWEMRAEFPGHGSLLTQHTFQGNRTYTPVTLRPDFVWRNESGALVVLDAKFAMASVAEFSMDETDVLGSSHAKSRDIVKMHAYRDAIEGVNAALVLFPGTNGAFWSEDSAANIRGISEIGDVIERIVAGDLNGIGAVPISPIPGG